MTAGNTIGPDKTADTIASTTDGVRPAIRALAAYRPGKSAAQVEREHGITEAIKLASNENPFAPLPNVVEAAYRAAADANLYADHRAAALRSALAEWIGVDVDQVTVGCGSVGILQQLCLTFVDPGDRVVFPWLSFEAYPVYTQMMNGVAVKPPLIDHGFDMEAVKAAVDDRTKLVLLATPNNPTGTAVSTAQVEDLLANIADSVIVLVDEAYREFNDPALGDPVHELQPRYRNLVVTRTFSKAYGLAGLRVGYAIADPAIITELDKILLAFAVNGAGQAAALAALESLDRIQPKIDAILAERARVAATLREAGHELPRSYGNFVYLPLGAATDDVCSRMERNGVVTRPFSGHGIRVTIGTDDQNDRFLAVLAEAVSEI